MGNRFFSILLLLHLSYFVNAGIYHFDHYSTSQTSITDTNQIQDLIQKGFELCADEYSKSLYYLDKAENMSKEIDYTQGIGDCNYIKSWVYYYRNN
jgi:CTP-dependent riboflavin kinase